ncbi:MAG: polysaccharide deacetylase family protein [Actinobacteria bacterium]|nr:MAG: polysaccharide deacetylase family protein [Actinomycetota bacterium]
MRTHEVVRPGPARARLVEALALALVAAGFMTAVYRPFSAIGVIVDRRAVETSWGSTVGDVQASGLTSAAPGDLLAADDGSVVETGAGGPVAARRDGAQVPAAARVYPGDVLAYTAGADVVESTYTTETVIEPPTVEIGAGPIAEVLDEGRAGRSRVTIGAASGRVVSETVLVEPRPVRIVRSGGTGGLKVVALTFDDGPWPGQTERVLSLLDEYDAKATFFMLGASAERYPALARRVVDEGHQAGNHTWSHTTDNSTPWVASAKEIDAAQTAIRRATGATPTWFRPPKGMLSPSLAEVAKARKLRVAMWSVDPWDWRRPGVTAIAQRTVGAIKPGAVVLLHDGGGDRAQTIEALEAVVRELKRRGYTFVTLDELAEIEAAASR